MAHSSLESLSSNCADFSTERQLLQEGYSCVCGVDEVGRGPLAGPVVTAAVILDPNHLPEGIKDSKKLSLSARLHCYEAILKQARAIAITSICAETIDASNIRAATLEAMRLSVERLALAPDYVLVDGKDVPAHLPCKGQAIIKGDTSCLSIAAASIIAKVTRDRLMERCGSFFQDYGFENHVGYGTKYHREKIEEKGAIERLHRFSFSPLKEKAR